jgi:hypothetical protein
MNSKTYYKIVATDKERLVSTHGHHCFIPGLKSVVVYKVGEFVSAPIMDGIKTKLFVFEGKEWALKFVEKLDVGDLHIFSCEVKNPKPFSELAAFYSEINSFWTNGAAIKNISPAGTRGCDKVKLIEEITI